MKKALAILSSISLVASTQAIQVQWTSGTIYLPDGTGALTGTTASSGVVQAYYFVVDATEYGSFSASEDFSERFDVAANGTIALKTGVSATYNRGSTGGGAANWAKSQADNADIPEETTRYVFAFFTYTDASNNGWYVAANPYATVAKNALAATGTYENIFTSASAGGWTAASAVPEPTTVALLALGLAAVGLKRKVA